MSTQLSSNHLINVAEQTEAVVLASVIAYPHLASDLLRHVRKAAVFYNLTHQYVYQAIAELYSQGEPIDLMTLTSALKKAGRGKEVGFIELAELGDNRYVVNIDSHCKILFELAVKRFLAEYSERMARQAYDPSTDAFILLHRLATDVDEILSGITSISKKTTNYYLSQVYADVQDKQSGKKKTLTLGIREIDGRTGGFAAGNYVIVAAGTGMGKTGVVVQMIRHQCLGEKNNIGLFSLEMTGAEVLSRLVAAETGYSNSEINRGHVDLARMQEGSKRLMDMTTLHIHDKPVESTELQYIIREWVRRNHVKAVIIDYLQLVKDNRYRSAYERVSVLSMDIKALAQELGIVIIAVSQLSRDFEKRGQKGDKLSMRPMMSDLRESGQLEQDANAILMLFRPHRYDIQYADGSVTEHTMEIHGVKFRGAKTTDRNSPWLFDYDGACNRIFRHGTMTNGNLTAALTPTQPNAESQFNNAEPGLVRPGEEGF